MIRKTVIVILSTLAVATVLLWWGYSGGDKPLKKVEWSREKMGLSFATSRGAFYVKYIGYTESTVSAKETWDIDSPEAWPIPGHIRLLSEYQPIRWFEHPEYQSLHYVFFCSHVGNVWFLTVLLSIYPAIAFIRGPLRRYRRRTRGLCVTCGYDLRGLSERRCPECKTPFEPTRSAPVKADEICRTPLIASDAPRRARRLTSTRIPPRTTRRCVGNVNSAARQATRATAVA